MPRFDLIAMDLDSTLLDWNGGRPTISDSCKEALLTAARSGIQLVIATGRILREVVLELETNGLPFGNPVPNFVIALEKYCYRVVNGEPQEDEVLASWNRERWAEARYVTEQIFLPNAADWLRTLTEAGLSPLRWVLDTRAGWLSLVYGDVDHARRVEPFLERFAQPFPEVVLNRNAMFVGLVPRNGTKGKALQFLTNYLGIPQDRVMAIGDSLNDLDMLNGEHGFFPVAVANAEPTIKAVVERAGGLLATQPASDGVAEAVWWALNKG